MTAPLADDIALHRLQVSIELRREPMDKYDQMRRLTGTVLYREGDSPEAEPIGLVAGWLSRDFDPELLAAAGDSAGPGAGVLTFFAEEIMKAEPGLPFPAALLVDRVVLDQPWRGRGISPAILARVLSVLQLDPQRTLILFKPEPLAADGCSPLEPGHGRDTATVKLRAVAHAADYRPWKRGLVWWRPLEAFYDE